MKEYLEAIKKLLIPFGVIAGIFGSIAYFAGEQWVRVLARDEIDASGAGNVADDVEAQGKEIIVVKKDVEDNDGEIVEVKDDAKHLEKRFNDLIQKIIDKI